MSIVCAGSVAYDYLMTFPGYFRDHIMAEHLDNISLSFLVDHMVRQRGGIAPNIAYTLALLGGSPRVFATVGEDFGEYRAWLESVGVDTSYTRVVPGKFTASFFANTDLANNQICSFYSGAMADASQLSLHELEADRPELVIISPTDPKAMDMYVAECKEMKLPYLYDPSQQLARTTGDEIKRGVDGAQSLFVNEYEFELLQKHTGLNRKQILEKVEFLVVTLGAKGAAIYVKDQEYVTSAVEPKAIADPTGVGDAFRGGFLAGYAHGFDWKLCGEIGSLSAVYCLEQRGTQNHSYTRQEFVQRFRGHFDDGGKLNVLLK